MKRIALATGLALALAAPLAPAAAQTRVSVALGFGVPQPYVSGVLVVGRPYVYYPAPRLVVVPAPRRSFYYRVPLVVVGRVYRVRHHHHHRYDYDDDDD